MSSPLPTAESQAGPLLITYFFSWTLFGVLSSQVFNYFLHFRSKDRLFLRLLVLLVYALEISRVVLLFVAYYGLFAQNWGNTTALSSWSGAWSELPLIGSTIMAFSQGLYVYRIWILGRVTLGSGGRTWVKMLVCAIVLAILTQYGTMIAETVHLRLTADYNVQFRTRASFIFSVIWASSGLACSGMIVCSTFWTLQRNDIKSQDIRDIVSNIFHIVIYTGVLTATLALLTLIFIILPKTGGAVLVTIGISPTVTSCSMMALLNARKKWKEGQRGVTVATLTRERFSPSETAAIPNVNTFGGGLDTTLKFEAVSFSDPREGVVQENVKQEIASEGKATIGNRTSSSTRQLDQLGRVQIKTEVTTSEL